MIIKSQVMQFVTTPDGDAGGFLQDECASPLLGERSGLACTENYRETMIKIKKENTEKGRHSYFCALFPIALGANTPIAIS